jgi:hypothetical protein
VITRYAQSDVAETATGESAHSRRRKIGKKRMLIPEARAPSTS